MSNILSPEVLAQLYGQESNDPFLTLLTLSHADFDDIRLVNNTADVISNGLTYTAFPFKMTLPKDDGETNREVTIELDNTGLDLITAIRSVTDPIDVGIQLVLSSSPDSVQMSFQELKTSSISYDKNRVQARLFMDSFLNSELTSERYTPSIFPGLF